MSSNKCWFVPVSVFIPSHNENGLMNRQEKAYPLHTIMEVYKEGDKTFIRAVDECAFEVDEDYYELVVRLNSYNNY